MSKLFFIFILFIFSSCGLESVSHTDSDSNENNSEQISSNPYTITHFDTNNALVIRYGSPYIWRVRTDSTSEFKQDTIDLYQYDTVDGIPEMMDAVAVSKTNYAGNADYIVVAMQRLGRNSDGAWSVNLPAYLAVIKQDGTEFDTGLGENGLKGIKLRVYNPYRRIFYDKYHNYIYIPGAGSLITNDGQGGIDRVKLNTDGTFSFDDDADSDGDNEYPFYTGHRVTDLVVFSNNKGAFIEYNDWGNTCLRSFDAGLGQLSATPDCEAGIGGSGVNIYALETYKDTSGEYLFVAFSDPNGAYIDILDTNFTVLKELETPDKLNPIDISVQYSLDNTDSYLRVAVALASSDWTSGALATVNCDSGINNCAFTPSTVINPTISDLAVSTYNKNIYLIERYQKDSISKFNIDDLDTGNYEPVWQFSTND